MERLQQKSPKQQAIVDDSEFDISDPLPTETDGMMQKTSDMDRARQLKEISDSCQSISAMIKNLKMT